MLYQAIRRGLARPILAVATSAEVRGLENVPERGPAILAGNHLSMLDPVLLAVAVPRTITFITRSEYFTGTGAGGRLKGRFFRAIGQLPVDRSGGTAGEAHLAAARQVLAAGDLFGIYPEGSRSPDGAIHRGHTGVARIALATRAPLIPVATTGSNAVFAGGRKLPSLRHRARPAVVIGPPVDLSRWRGLPVDAAVLRAVTEELMSTLARMTGLPVDPSDARTLREQGVGRPAPPAPAD